MMYDELEDELCLLLQPLKNPLAPNLSEIIPYPETQEDPNKEKFKEWRIWIAYAGSDFEKPKSLGVVVQDEKLQLNVTIRTKKRRGAEGIYGLIEQVNKLVLGYRPAKYGFNRLYLISNNFTSFERGEWCYTLVYGLESLIAQVVPQETDNTFKGISFKNVNTQTI